MKMRIIASMVATLSAFACATTELREATEAREAYEGCVEEYSESHLDCELLKERHLAAQRRYESAPQLKYNTGYD